MNLEFGRWGFSFLGASVFNSLPSDIEMWTLGFYLGKRPMNVLIVIFIQKLFYVFSM